MGRRAADGRTGLSVRRALVGALVLAATACGDGDPRAEIPAEGVILASGPGAPWNLMSLPRDGGPAGLVAFATGPADSAGWQGSASLPSFSRAYRLGSRHLALLRSDGGVERYDPVRDLVSRVGQTDPDAEWTAHDRWGLFRPPDGRTLLQIAPGGAWTYQLERPAVWAAPAGDGSVVALLPADGEGAELVHYERGVSEPTVRLAGAFAASAVITGFGAQVAAARRVGDGDSWELVLVSLPELEVVGTTSLPGRPGAIATSPSFHELYLSVADRLLVFGRPDLRLREERGLPAPVRTLRPGFLGGPLLARSDGAVHLVPWHDSPRTVDSEWRADLPLSLPDGSVLAVRGATVVRVPPEGGEGRPVGPADRWWIPVRWHLPDGEARTAEAGALADAGEDPRPGGGESGEPAAAPAAEAGEPTAGTGSAFPVAGFYAVVAAARDRAGVERLLSELRSEGWETDIHEWRDDAGRRWHRGLVGPFSTRPEAERAARRLQRDRDLSVWVKELGPGLSGEG